MEGGWFLTSPMKIASETETSRSAARDLGWRKKKKQVDRRRSTSPKKIASDWFKNQIDCPSWLCKHFVGSDVDLMYWMVKSTYSLCDLARTFSLEHPPHIYKFMHLVVELSGWRSYLISILSLSEVFAKELTNNSVFSKELTDNSCVVVSGLIARVDEELAVMELLLEKDVKLTFGKNKHAKRLFGENIDPIHQNTRRLFLGHIRALRERESTAVFSGHATTGIPVDEYTLHMANLEKPTLSDHFTDQETTRIPVEENTLHMANLKKPTLRDAAAVAASCSKVSPFHVEMFDLKAAVAALSGPLMAKLKMQAETKDEVFLLWEAGDKNMEPPPAVANIRTHVLSAQLKGHDTDHRGRVDYQLFSPLIDFNLEEESSLQPGRHTDSPAPWLNSSANILSIKVADSCRGFPVRLYGSVLVTDTLDDKGIYLFHRERDDPQFINSKDEALFLVGPSRGLVVFDYLTFEFDLKMRFGDEQADDLDFSQGTIEYNSIFSEPPFISDKLSSPLSTVELNYAPVRRALEATVEIQIVQDSSSFPASTQSEDVEYNLFGKLYGKISACCIRSTKEIVLFDSAVSGTMFTVGDDGVLELWRRVLSVSVEDSLVVIVETWSGDDGGLSRVSTKLSFVFTPVLCGEGHAVVPCDGFKMQIKVVWSALYIPELDG